MHKNIESKYYSSTLSLTCGSEGVMNVLTYIFETCRSKIYYVEVYYVRYTCSEN